MATTDSTGREGVHAVGLQISRLGWIFREQMSSDFGIDAIVETTDHKGLPTGSLIALQIKAGKSYLREHTATDIVYRGTKRHLDYWLATTIPIVLILCDLDRNRLYWQSVSADSAVVTRQGWKLKVPFSQRLDAQIKEQWTQLARPKARLLRAGYLGDATEFTLDESPSNALLSSSSISTKLALAKVGKKYRPDLYVERESHELLWKFLTAEGSKSEHLTKVLVVTERAGSGKTNLMCRLAEMLPESGFPTVFILASDAIEGRDGLVLEVLRALGSYTWKSDGGSPSVTLRELVASIPFCVLIDALNESRDLELLGSALRELLAALKGTNARVLLSCRDIYWPFVQGDWQEVLGTEIADLPLYHFTDNEWPLVKERYFSAFSIVGDLVDSAERVCRHPLLLRFFCEAFAGEGIGIVSEVRLGPLFDRYLEKKVTSLTVRQKGLRAQEVIVEKLLAIAEAIFATSELSCSEQTVAEITDRGRDHLGGDSLYVRLLDEDIVIEEIPVFSSRGLQRHVRFVYEAFHEFLLAKSLESRWRSFNDVEILSDVRSWIPTGPTGRQLLGVLEFLESFLERRSLNLWFTLMENRVEWQGMFLRAAASRRGSELTPTKQRAIEYLLNKGAPESRLLAVELLRGPTMMSFTSISVGLDLIGKRLKCDSRAEVRRACQKILVGHWDDLTPDFRMEVCRGAVDRAKEIRNEAKRVIQRLTGAESQAAKEMLLEYTRSPDPKVRSYAVTALDLELWPEVRPRLYELSTDSYAWTRTGVLIMLMKQPSAEDVPYMRGMLSDVEPRVRSLAAIAVGSTPHDSDTCRAILRRLQEEENAVVISRLVGALGGLRCTDGRGACEKFLRHADYFVRTRAGSSLSQIVGIEALPILLNAHRRSDTSEITWPDTWISLTDLGGPKELTTLLENGLRHERLNREETAFLCGLVMGNAEVWRSRKTADVAADWLRREVVRLPSRSLSSFLEGMARAHSPHSECVELILDSLENLAKDAGPHSQWVGFLLGAYAGSVSDTLLDAMMQDPVLRLGLSMGIARRRFSQRREWDEVPNEDALGQLECSAGEDDVPF